MGGLMVPMMGLPPPPGSTAAWTIEGLKKWIKDFKSGNNLYDLDDGIGKNDYSESDKRASYGLLPLGSFFWVTITCTNYIGNTAENQKAEEDGSGDSDGVFQNDIDNYAKSRIASAEGIAPTKGGIFYVYSS